MGDAQRRDKGRGMRGRNWGHIPSSHPSSLVPTLLGFFYDAYHPPALFARKRAALHDLDGIANAALVVLVMRLELLGALDGTAIERVLFEGRYLDNSGL